MRRATDVGFTLVERIAQWEREYGANIAVRDREVLLCRPLVTAVGQELIVILTCIMNRIKQVLKIVERNTIPVSYTHLDVDKRQV